MTSTSSQGTGDTAHVPRPDQDGNPNPIPPASHDWPFGTVAKRRMRELGLSANTLAAISGVGRSTVKNLLRGRRSNGLPFGRRGPDPRNILAVARVIDPDNELSSDQWLTLANLDPARYTAADLEVVEPEPSEKVGRPTAIARRVAFELDASLNEEQKHAVLAVVLSYKQRRTRRGAAGSATDDCDRTAA